MKILSIILLLTILNTAAADIKFTAYEEGAVVSGANMAYSYGLLTLDTNTFSTAIEPYMCWEFPVEWNVFYSNIEVNVKKQLAAMTPKERKNQGENFKYRVWQAVYEEYGCEE